MKGNKIEQRGVYYLLRDLVSPQEQECALISLYLQGNPGCDSRAEDVLNEMNRTTAGSPIYSALRPEVSGVLSKWAKVKKGNEVYIEGEIV